MLSQIKSYAEFPRSQEWIEQHLRRVLGLESQPPAVK
jgi:hypothetical protein